MSRRCFLSYPNRLFSAHVLQSFRLALRERHVKGRDLPLALQLLLVILEQGCSGWMVVGNVVQATRTHDYILLRFNLLILL